MKFTHSTNLSIFSGRFSVDSLAKYKNALFHCFTLGGGMFDKFKFLEIQFFFSFFISSLRSRHCSTSHSTLNFTARRSSSVCKLFFFSFHFPLPKAGSAMEVFLYMERHECVVKLYVGLETLSSSTHRESAIGESRTRTTLERGPEHVLKKIKEFCAKRMKLSLESTHR